jgi:hypothetical protein
LHELADAAALLPFAGAAAMRVAGMAIALRRTRRLNAFPFENADLRGMYDAEAAGGWCLEIVPRASHLATHHLENAITVADRFARGIGAVLASRLRRFDLAADYANFPLEPSDIESFVTMRARRESFLEDSKDLDEASGELCKPRVVEHRRKALEVTGFTFAPGNPQMGRIYVKSTELLLPGREVKREIEHALWRHAGWDGLAPVTRAEFQHRGVFLDEIQLRDPAQLLASLDAVWQRDTTWLRMVHHAHAKSTRAYRAPLDPRWEAVQRTVFAHPAAPIPRSRAHRGGARPEHVLGAAISRVAAGGDLSKLDFRATEHGEVVNHAAIGAMSDDEAAAWLRATAAKVFGAAAADTVRNLLGRGSPRAGARRLFTKLEAAEARFSSIDDEGEPS